MAKLIDNTNRTGDICSGDLCPGDFYGRLLGIAEIFDPCNPSNGTNHHCSGDHCGRLLSIAEIFETCGRPLGITKICNGDIYGRPNKTNAIIPESINVAT